MNEKMNEIILIKMNRQLYDALESLNDVVDHIVKNNVVQKKKSTALSEQIQSCTFELKKILREEYNVSD